MIEDLEKEFKEANGRIRRQTSRRWSEKKLKEAKGGMRRQTARGWCGRTEAEDDRVIRERK